MASPSESNPLEDADEQATSVNGEVQDSADADAPSADVPDTASAPDASGAPDAAPEGPADNEPIPTFQGDALDATLADASEEVLNQTDFGIIKVDDEGVVLFFNQYESELSGVAPEDAIGKNFFTEIAPCTNNRLFRGRFKKGVRKDDLDETFTYTYTYRMQPTLVTIHLYRDSRGENWIMVQKF